MACRAVLEQLVDTAEDQAGRHASPDLEDRRTTIRQPMLETVSLLLLCAILLAVIQQCPVPKVNPDRFFGDPVFS